jgi:uncharacterized protein (DUF433 family)
LNAFPIFAFSSLSCQEGIMPMMTPKRHESEADMLVGQRGALYAHRPVRYFLDVRLGLYSGKQVCRLARISVTQLRYWYRTRVFQPETIDGETGAFRRVYSFRDVVGLRTISTLRNQHHVKLDDLREVERRLKATPEAAWSDLVFYLGRDGKIYFDDPRSGKRVALHPVGQVSLFPMVAVIRSVERQLALLNRRTKRQIGKIEQNRNVMRAASVIAGTRVPTSAIYDLHRSGFTFARIISEYPRLKEKDVRAAIRFEELKLAG